MKKLLSVWMIIALLAPFVRVGAQSAPTRIDFSLQIKDPEGEVYTTPFDFRFSFWKTPLSDDAADFDADNNLVGDNYSGYFEVQTISSDASGNFTAEIGAVNPLPTLDYDGFKYLQVEVKAAGANTPYFKLDADGDPLLDRQKLQIQPYAINASTLQGRTPGTNPGDIAYLNEDGKIAEDFMSDNIAWQEDVAELQTQLNSVQDPTFLQPLEDGISGLDTRVTVLESDPDNALDIGAELAGKTDLSVFQEFQNQTLTGLGNAASVQSVSDLSTALGDLATLTGQIQAEQGNKASIVDVQAALALKADLTALDALDAIVSQNTLDILTKASQADLLQLQSDLNDQISNNTNLTQAQADILVLQGLVAQKADSSDLSALDVTVAAQAAELLTKASQADLDAIAILVAQNTTDIATKADQTEVDALATTVTDQGTNLALKSDQTDVDAIDARVAALESEGLSSEVLDDIAAIESSLANLQTGIGTKSDQSDVDALSTRLLSLEQDPNVNFDIDSALAGKVSNSDFLVFQASVQASLDSLQSAGIVDGDDFTALEALVSVLSDDQDDLETLLGTKVGIADFNILSSQVGSNTQTISNLQNQITNLDFPEAEVSQESLDLVENKVDQNEFRLTQLDENKVDESDVYTKTEVDIKFQLAALGNSAGDTSAITDSMAELQDEIDDNTAAIAAMGALASIDPQDFADMQADLVDDVNALALLTTRVAAVEQNGGVFDLASDTDFQALQADVDAAEVNINSNTNEVSSLDTRVTTLENAGGTGDLTQNTDFQALQTQSDATDTAVGDLQTASTTAAADIAAAEADIVQAQADIVNNVTTLGTLLVRVTDLENAQIDPTQFLTVQTSLVQALNDISAMDARITALENAGGAGDLTQNSDFNDLAARVTTVEQSNGGTFDILADTNFQALNTSVGTLNTDLAALQTQVNTNTADIAALQNGTPIDGVEFADLQAMALAQKNKLETLQNAGTIVAEDFDSFQALVAQNQNVLANLNNGGRINEDLWDALKTAIESADATIMGFADGASLGLVDFNNLNGLVTGIGVDIADLLNGSVSDLATVVDLSDRVTTNEEAIAALDLALANIGGSGVDLLQNTDFTALQSQVAQNSAAIATKAEATDLSTLQSSVTTNTGSINSNQNSIANNSGSILANAIALGSKASQSALSSLSDTVDDHTVDLATHSAAIDSNTAGVANNAAALAGKADQSAINGLTTTLTSYGSLLTDHESRLSNIEQNGSGGGDVTTAALNAALAGKSNVTDFNALESIVNGHTTTIGSNTTRITALEAGGSGDVTTAQLNAGLATKASASDLDTLELTVGGQGLSIFDYGQRIVALEAGGGTGGGITQTELDTALAGKADQSAIDALSSQVQNISIASISGGGGGSDYVSTPREGIRVFLADAAALLSQNTGWTSTSQNGTAVASIPTSSTGDLKVFFADNTTNHIIKLRIGDGDRRSIFKAELVTGTGNKLLGHFSNSYRKNKTDLDPEGQVDVSDYFEWVDVPVHNALINAHAFDTTGTPDAAYGAYGATIRITPATTSNGFSQNFATDAIGISDMAVSRNPRGTFISNILPHHYGLTTGIPDVFVNKFFWLMEDWNGHNLVYISYDEYNGGWVRVPAMFSGISKKLSVVTVSERWSSARVELVDDADQVVWVSPKKYAEKFLDSKIPRGEISWEIPSTAMLRAVDADGFLKFRVYNEDDFADRFYIHEFVLEDLVSTDSVRLNVSH